MPLDDHRIWATVKDNILEYDRSTRTYGIGDSKDPTLVLEPGMQGWVEHGLPTSRHGIVVRFPERPIHGCSINIEHVDLIYLYTPLYLTFTE